MVVGGVIVIDDYGFWLNGEWLGCVCVVYEFIDLMGVSFVKFDMGNVVFFYCG